MKFKFVRIIEMQKRKTSTAKDLKKSIIKKSVKQDMGILGIKKILGAPAILLDAPSNTYQYLG